MAVLLLAAATPCVRAGEVARGELGIIGLGLEVQREPVVTAVDVPAYVQTRFGDAAPAPGLAAVGDLTGPGIDTPITLTTIPGQRFAIPALHEKGDYLLQNIRLVGSSGEYLQQAIPSVATIRVADVLTTNVKVRQLTPDELRERGIIIDDRNYEAYEYTFIFSIDGQQVEIPYPVILDKRTRQIVPAIPPSFRMLPLPTRQKPPRFTPPYIETFDLSPSGAPPTGEQRDREPRRPAVGLPAALVIPSGFGVLHQFFAVVLQVSNSSPEGSNLRLDSITATVNSPLAMRVAKQMPAVALGQPVPIVDERTGATFLVAGAQGSAEWTLEALKAGTHTVDIDVRATYQKPGEEDFAIGGRVSTSIVVSDPRFHVNFSHPDVVRKDDRSSLYAAHFYLTEGRGRVAIPIAMGTSFRIAGVDAATGLERFSRTYEPIVVGDPGTTVNLPPPNDDREGPYPIGGSPFRVEIVDVAMKDVRFDSVRNFSVELSNGIITASPQDGFNLPSALLNVTNGAADVSLDGGLSVRGAAGDRVVLLIGEKDVDPDVPLSLTFSEAIVADDPASLFRLTVDGVATELNPRFDTGGRRVIFDHVAALMRGRTYRLEIDPAVMDASKLRIGQTRNADGTVTPGLNEALSLSFKVREPAGKVASFDLGAGVIRDQALIGNVLFVSALDAGIYAFDVSNPAGLAAGVAPLGHHAGDATAYWALAHDHHGRIYATGMTSMMGVVRSFRIEDFVGNADVRARGGASVSFNPGTAAALNIASRVIASDRPEAVPRKLQVVVSDREIEYADRTQFKAAGATVVNAFGDFEELRFESAFNPSLHYSVQRVTVENATLDMRWSADAMYGRPAQIAGIVARPDDRIRVLYNELTYGVVTLLGYGVSVVDLNAIDSNDAPVKPQDYVPIRELIRLTSGAVGVGCDAVADHAIPDLEFTPDAIIRTTPAGLNVYALDPHRGVLDLLIRPPRSEIEAALPPDRVVCDERMSGTGLVFRNTIPLHDHPRLAKLRALYEAKTGRPPHARFSAAASYSWTLPAKENAVVTPAGPLGTRAIGRRGSSANEKVHREYMLIPAADYGLLVVEVGGDAPAASMATGPALHDDLLVDVVWVPTGAAAIRVLPGFDIAAVTDAEGHVLLVDLARLDERWDVGASELFPTVRAILERDVTIPDPRIVWRSSEPLASGTLAPVVSPTGFVFAGKLLERTTNVISAFDPHLQMRAATTQP